MMGLCMPRSEHTMAFDNYENKLMEEILSARVLWTQALTFCASSTILCAIDYANMTDKDHMTDYARHAIERAVAVLSYETNYMLYEYVAVQIVKVYCPLS